MPEPLRHACAAIVGLGNILLTDDGVGVHAVRKLREDAPEGIILAEIGTAVLDALDLFERVELVVAIDAVRAGGPPGSIYSFSIDEVETHETISLHELGIVEVMQYLSAESVPEIVIIGVEPAVIDYGMELSSAVSAMLPDVVLKARAMALQLMEKIPQQRECDYGKM